jgi:hypothetical protein
MAKVPCPLGCPAKFSSWIYVKKHVDQHGPKHRKCPTCGNIFVNLGKHMLHCDEANKPEEHGSLARYTHGKCRCDLCTEANTKRTAEYRRIHGRDGERRVAKKVTAYELECINCRRSFLYKKDDFPPPLGYQGSFFLHHEGGGGGANFFICLKCEDLPFSELMSKALLKESGD